MGGKINWKTWINGESWTKLVGKKMNKINSKTWIWKNWIKIIGKYEKQLQYQQEQQQEQQYLSTIRII